MVLHLHQIVQTQSLQILAFRAIKEKNCWGAAVSLLHIPLLRKIIIHSRKALPLTRPGCRAKKLDHTQICSSVRNETRSLQCTALAGLVPQLRQIHYQWNLGLTSCAMVTTIAPAVAFNSGPTVSMPQQDLQGPAVSAVLDWVMPSWPWGLVNQKKRPFLRSSRAVQSPLPNNLVCVLSSGLTYLAGDTEDCFCFY